VDEEPAAPAAFDFGKKKKKPKKKTEPSEDGAETAAVDEKPDPAESTSTTTDATDSKEITNANGSGKSAAELAAAVAAAAQAMKPTDEYTYEFLVNRIFATINASRPEEKTVYKMKPPVVYREGTKKTVWVNFPEICKIMNRQPEHVLAFVLAEVGSTGSIDGSGRLVIKGKFQPKHVENILRHYISEYVKCHTCKSPETVLKKENRLLFMVCEKCQSSRSVAAIKSGFQATTRASREEQRRKAGN